MEERSGDALEARRSIWRRFRVRFGRVELDVDVGRSARLGCGRVLELDLGELGFGCLIQLDFLSPVRAARG